MKLLRALSLPYFKEVIKLNLIYLTTNLLSLLLPIILLVNLPTPPPLLELLMLLSPPLVLDFWLLLLNGYSSISSQGVSSMLLPPLVTDNLWKIEYSSLLVGDKIINCRQSAAEAWLLSRSLFDFKIILSLSFFSFILDGDIPIVLDGFLNFPYWVVLFSSSVSNY